MKLEKQKEALVLSDGDSQESIKMSLDLESAQVLMQMLSKNLYSDAIGSTIREAASNALDSHRRAKTDKPIIVTFKLNDEGNFNFTVEDFGMGLDDDEVRNIISKYGKSTKRDSSTELGMMGLGFKAPLAYTSTFYFIARKDGMERKYMMYEGEDVNTIDLLYEQPTTEGNGLKIIVPVKWNDRQEFVKKMREQLAYFESVYFDVAPVSAGYYGTVQIENDFKIFRTEHYQHSTLTDDKNMHICLDNVYYPIDWNKLGIPQIGVPIGLRFSLTDGIFPTPNRESIRYTTEAKAAIMKKIKLVANLLVIKYNSTISDTDDVMSVIEHYSSTTRYIKINDKEYAINSLITYATAPVLSPKIKGVRLLDLGQLFTYRRQTLLAEYDTTYELRNGALRELKNRWSNEVSLSSTLKCSIYLLGLPLTAKKRDYIKSLPYKSSGLYIVRKKRTHSLWPKRTSDGKTTDELTQLSYWWILDLKKYPRSSWRARIKEFQSLQNFFTKNFVDVDTLEIPQEWLNARKKTSSIIITAGGVAKRKPIKLHGEIIAKIAKPIQKYMDDRNAVFSSVTYKIEEICTKNKLFIYTHHDDFLKLDALFPLVTKNDKLTFITLSSRELKLIKDADIHNLISYEKFMEGKNKPFKRIATALLIHELREKYNYLFSKKHKLDGICTSLYTSLQALEDYHSDNYVVLTSQTRQAILEVARNTNLWDEEIFTTYTQTCKILAKLTFIEPLFNILPYYTNDGEKGLITDLFRFYKFKMDNSMYGKKVEIVLDEDQEAELGELDEDKLEELTDSNNN